MSMRRCLMERGVAEERIQRMEADKIDVHVIPEMSDGDLQEYLPCKGDRVAVQAFAREENSNDGEDKRKLALIESLRCRMGIAGTSGTSRTPGSDDDEVIVDANKRRKLNPKKPKKTFYAKLTNVRKKSGKQATIASKKDRAVAVGFAIYDSTTKKYRQIRAPMGGGTRYPRVSKNAKKTELLGIICPLFFPDGTNCHGAVYDFIFDLSTDVHGTQLMHDESLEYIMTRLGLKHFRCYLLAKRQKDYIPSSEDSLPEGLPNDGTKQGNTSSEDIRPTLLHTDDTKQGNSSSPTRSSVSVDLVNEPGTKSGEGIVRNDNICNFEFTGVSLDVETSETLQPEISFDSTLIPEHSQYLENNDTNFDTSNQPVLIQYVADMAGLSVPSSSSVSEDIPTDLATEYLHTSVTYDSDDSGVIQFRNLQQDATEPNTTSSFESEITLHRGRVCRDLIDFFSQDNHQSNHSTTFVIKMLKEDGKPELAVDNGGVMRDCLTEFWDTFYLQYTEGNTYKVPVLRHDMTAVQWKAVAAVIRMGFIQEGVYPIKLAPSFMQQAIFGACNDSDVIDSFLKFVSVMDKDILEIALRDFKSVEMDDINDVMEQYGAKKLINGDNIKCVVQEIAHKELVQKPMFVADCFYNLLSTTPLVQENMSVLYSKLKPSPKKVLNSLKFPEQMTQEETTLSSYIKRLVREMDDPQSLQLFLRFVTGSDIMTQKDIHIRFTSSDASDNIRCPSSHACGSVLEIPRSYAQDPYVLLKSDFLSLLKSRYVWEMDIV